jgi:hypothetical protein
MYLTGGNLKYSPFDWYHVGLVGLVLIGLSSTTIAATVRKVQLVVSTMETYNNGTFQQVEPIWKIELDRDMAVQMSSEESVAQCEELLSNGHKLCMLFLPPCLAISIDHRGSRLLTVYPSRCEASDDLFWSVTSKDATFTRIPLKPEKKTP